MTYGERLKEIRIYLRMTQQKFAESISLKKKQTISDLENNKQQKLMKKNEKILIEKFNINPNYLLIGGEMFEKNGSMVQSGSNNNQQRSGGDSIAGERGLALPDEIASIVKILKTFDKKQQRAVLNFVWDIESGV